MQRIRFADGTEMTASDFANRWVTSTASDDSEMISGFYNVKNEMYALGGDDYLYGKGLSDILDGGAGNDYVAGGAGNDTLYGGEGNDNLYGGEGDDILSGGPGNDYLEGWSGVDTYRFSRGDGSDSISASERGHPRVRCRDHAGLPAIHRQRLGPDRADHRYGGPGLSCSTTVGTVRFADGTVWTPEDIKTACSMPSTERRGRTRSRGPRGARTSSTAWAATTR